MESRLGTARKAGHLRESTIANILALIAGSKSPLYRAVIVELLDNEEWSELNDRFFRTLAFGTGGLRGRTMGKVVTKAERGAQNNARSCERVSFFASISKFEVGSSRA